MGIQTGNVKTVFPSHTNSFQGLMIFLKFAKILFESFMAELLTSRQCRAFIRRQGLLLAVFDLFEWG